MWKGPRAVDPPDGGWGWAVVAGAFVSSALVFGAVITYPLFYFPIMQEFGVGLGEVTWLTGVFEIGKALGYLFTPGLVGLLGYRGAGMLASVASGISISVASCVKHLWFIFILAGAVPGLVMGVYATLVNVVVARYFAKRRLLAVGIGQAGSAIGTLALSPLMQHFIDVYGWRGGMLLFGGLTLNVAVATSLFRPIRLKTDIREEKATSKEACFAILESGKRIAKLPMVWLMCAVFFCVYGGVRAYMRFLVPYAQDNLHIETMAASLVLSAYSMVSVFARVVFGALGDHKKVSSVAVLIVTQFLTAVIAGTVWFVRDYAGLVANSVAHSVANGPTHTMYVSVIIGVVGESDLAWGYTVIGFISSVTGSAIVPLIGTLVDATGEMRVAFVTAAVLGIISAFLHFPLLHNKKEVAKLPENSTQTHQKPQPDCTA